MKKSKIKKLLIILSIVILVIIIIIIIVNNNINKENKDNKNNIYEVPFDIGDPEKEKKEFYFKDYINIKNCIQTYIDILNINNSRYYGYNDKNQYVDITNENDKKQNIYDLLSKDFIQKNNISVDNIYDYIQTTKEDKIVIPTNITNQTNDDNMDIVIYKVESLIISTNNKEQFYYQYFVLNIDNKNNTFSIQPAKDKNDLNSIEIKNDITTIEENDNNYFSNKDLTQEDTALEYFSNYKNIILSDSELAYSYLDNDYKQKRFGNIDSFNNYIKENRKLLEQMRMQKYEIIYYDDYIEYICIDQYNNTYIFNEKDPLKYSALLDIYTTDLQKFTEKYDSSTTQEKVLLNIEKIKQAINSGDYSYAYSKLDEQFKKNNYKTENIFEEYLKNNLFKYNKIDYRNFTNQGNVYIYNIIVKDLIGESNKEVNMQIIMQLKDNRDFVMSFSIK
jgi:hypothetical protein